MNSQRDNCLGFNIFFFKQNYRYPNVDSGNLGCHVNMRNFPRDSGTPMELLGYSSKQSRHSFLIVKTKYDPCNIFCIISNTSIIQNR